MAVTDLLPLRGKKKEIALLLLEEKYTDQEIADKVGCKVRYVWNVRSEFKTSGLWEKLQEELKKEDEDSQVTDSIGESERELSDRKLELKKEGTESGAIENKSAPADNELLKKGTQGQVVHEQREKRLTRKELMIVYSGFLRGLKPPEVISKHGFDPELVELEYEKFLRHSERNIDRVQKRVMEWFDIEGSDNSYNYEIRELGKRYSKQGYLSDEDFFDLIHKLCFKYFDDGKNALADDYDVDPPRGWVQPCCSKCGLPIKGKAAVNPETEMGRRMLIAVKGYAHGECVDKTEQSN